MQLANILQVACVSRENLLKIGIKSAALLLILSNKMKKTRINTLTV